MNLLEGKLSETSVDGVLSRLRASAQTGILTLQNDEDIVAISVEKGEIVGADALNESLEEGLGVVLIGEGLVTEAEFESATSRVGAQDGRIARRSQDDAWPRCTCRPDVPVSGRSSRSVRHPARNS